MKKIFLCSVFSLFPPLFFTGSNLLLRWLENWTNRHYIAMPLYLTRLAVFVLLGCIVGLLGMALKSATETAWIPASIAVGFALTVTCFMIPFLLPPPEIGPEGFACAGVLAGVWACWFFRSLYSFRHRNDA